MWPFFCLMCHLIFLHNHVFAYLTIRKLTLPPTATGLSKMPCMPKIADCGGLIMGVPNMDPNTPPLLMVKVPPSMSSTASSFLRACRQTSTITVNHIMRKSQEKNLFTTQKSLLQRNIFLLPIIIQRHIRQINKRILSHIPNKNTSNNTNTR